MQNKGSTRWLKEEEVEKRKRKLKKEEEDNEVFFKYAPYYKICKERIFYSAEEILLRALSCFFWVCS